MRRLVAAVVLLVLTTAASASVRPFGFVYDAYALGKGNFELEQWVTAGYHTPEDHDFQRYDFRTELEMGLADNFTLSVYLPNWSYEDSASRNDTNFDGASVEAIVYLTNPVTDKVGLALYNEVSVGNNEVEFEHKLIVHKDIENWTLAYNLVIETEIEGVGDENQENEIEGVIGNALGISYALGRYARVGAELTVEDEFDDWHKHTETSVYAGPNFNYISGNHWWFTVTPVFQLTNIDDLPDYQVRAIFGWEF
jgi:hypothetical protein